MKIAVMYWGLIAVIGIVHLQALLTNLPWDIPIYMTCLLILGIIYHFYKTNILQVSHLGTKCNGILFCLQLLLLLIYVAIDSSWVYLVPLLVFIGIESIRLIGARKLASLNQNLQHVEEQQIHFNETFRIVRGERHDFLKHVAAIHFLIETGKHDEAKTYLDDLVDGYAETNLSIKGERGIVAGVLHQMYRRAQAAGISVVYDIDVPLSTLPLSDNHMVTLLGNLLSNSIDACEAWQQKYQQQAQMTLQFYKRSGLYLLICRNNSLPIPTAILDELFHSYGKTTKADEHEGLGTKMIHDIVNDHQGFLDFVYKEEVFTVKIKIPAIR